MLIQSIKMAWSAISSNKMRSFLTMLGIIIGIISLVVMVSLVNGAASSVTGEIEGLGTNLISVMIRDDKGSPMTLTEMEKLVEKEGIERIAPAGSMSATAKYAYTTYNVSVYGTTAAYEDIHAMEVESGRFLRTTDVENSAYVVVVSQKAATKIFGRTDVVGEHVSIGGYSLLVVGVLAEDDSMMAQMMGSAPVYVPFTVQARLSGQTHVTSFNVSADNEDDLYLAENSLKQAMLQRFRQDEDAFMLLNQSTLLSTMDTVMGTLTILLGGVAAISLLVGGIGIMNIMLVSVTERTREIGIRKAIGAGRGSILTQFLIEALMLSVIGCIIGLGLSWVLLEVITFLANGLVTFVMSADIIILAVSFSIGIGVLFGMYPAGKASKKHPIEALRYEG
jgi:putative ABC transport system permease protein